MDPNDDRPPDSPPTDPRNLRRPWTEGPDEDAPEESWLSLGDDELLHRIETLEPGSGADDRLLEVVQSDRHFFIRQEAAKKVGSRSLLFPFEDDRHIGQILVRYLNRREDVTYLERLVARSRHAEVRAAAQVQLAQLWGRLGGPATGVSEGEEAPPPPVFAKPTEPQAPPPPSGPPAAPEAEIEIDVELDGATEAEEAPAAGAEAPSVKPTAVEPAVTPAALAPAAVEPRTDEPAGAVDSAAESELERAVAEAEAHVEAAARRETRSEPETAVEDGVDGSLLGWAVHFLVEQVWTHLDTRAARGLLLRTHAELLPFQPALAFFRIEEDAHVHVDLTGGARLPPEAVAGVAAWMAAFLEATRASVPDIGEIDVRQSTHLMEDALEQVGFYEAFRELEEA